MITPEAFGKLIPSGKNNPCPICGRTKDGDCRIRDDQELVLCHKDTEHTVGDKQNGYTWRGATKDGRAGIWTLSSSEFRKERTPDSRFTYPFYDRHGTLIASEVRVYLPGGQKKVYWTPSGADMSVLRPYRYQDCLEALEAVDSIGLCFITEGPHKAEMLWSLGIPATCFAGGFKPERDKWLFSGFETKLVVCVDRDRPGIEKANKILEFYPMASYLLPDPRSAWWHDELLPEKDGYDVGDWVQEGADLLEIVDSVVRWQLPSQQKEAEERDDIKRLLLELIDGPETTRRVQIEAQLYRKFSLTKEGVMTSALDLLSRRFIGDYPKAENGKRKYFTRRPGSLDESFDWLLPGIVPAAGSTIWIGEAGSGKTTLALQLAYAVMTGERFLDSPPAKTGKVLVIDSDAGSSITEATLNYQGTMEPAMEMMTAEQAWQADLEGLLALAEAAQSQEYSLIIIDSLKSVTDGTSWNIYHPSISSLCSFFQNVVGKFTPLLILHHTNRSGTGIQASAGCPVITSTPHGCIRIEPKQTEGREEVGFDLLKLRGTEKKSLTLARNTENGLWLEVVEGARNFGPNSATSAVLAVVAEAAARREKLTSQQILERVQDRSPMNYGALHMAISRLCSSGLLRRSRPRNGTISLTAKGKIHVPDF